MRVVLLGAAVLALAACGSAGSGSAGKRTDGVTVARAPLPVGTGSRYELVLDHVACASSRDCAATGDLYRSAQHAVDALLLVERSGSWTVSEPPLPPNLGNGSRSGIALGSVACPALGRCIAVAGAHAGAEEEPLILTQHGDGWRESVVPLPAGAKGGYLALVSCPSAGACTAAGGYVDSAGEYEALLVSESGGRWGTPSAVAPPRNAARHASSFGGARTVAIDSLSCASAGDCTAVGVYTDRTGSPEGLLLNETAGSWARGVEAQLPANAAQPAGSYLYPVTGMGPVSCASAADCTAVGGYADRRSNQFGMTLSEHDGRWAAAQEVSLPRGAGLNPQQGNLPASPMASIACPAAGSCSADGTYVDEHGNDGGLLLAERAGTWTASTLVAPSGADPARGGSVGSLACTSAGNCLAVGSYGTGAGEYLPLLVAERKGVWTTGVTVPLPAGNGQSRDGRLDSVSCPPAGACVAVGTYTDASGKQQGVLVTIPGRS